MRCSLGRYGPGPTGGQQLAGGELLSCGREGRRCRRRGGRQRGEVCSGGRLGVARGVGRRGAGIALLVLVLVEVVVVGKGRGDGSEACALGLSRGAPGVLLAHRRRFSMSSAWRLEGEGGGGRGREGAMGL